MFELVQIEIGLEGNFLVRDYQRFGNLASHTWFKVLWEYLHYFKVELHLDGVVVPKVRERDKVFGGNHTHPTPGTVGAYQ